MPTTPVTRDAILSWARHHRPALADRLHTALAAGTGPRPDTLTIGADHIPRWSPDTIDRWAAGQPPTRPTTVLTTPARHVYRTVPARALTGWEVQALGEWRPVTAVTGFDGIITVILRGGALAVAAAAQIPARHAYPDPDATA